MTAAATTPASTSPSSEKSATSRNKRRKRWWPFIVLPYIVGIAWTCLHPIVSVITGEAKCRGSFIDESSLDLGALRLTAKYTVPTTSNDSSSTRMRSSIWSSSSLCESLLQNTNLRDNVECIQHEEMFEVAKVVPISNAVEPTEVVVIVVPESPPPDKTWTTSDVHNALLQFITRLSLPSSCPWLAKTIMVVSPCCAHTITNTSSTNDTTTSLDASSTVVSTFLDSFLGGSSTISPLPMQFTFGILRNLLVVDIHVREPTTSTKSSSVVNKVRILPQGRKGILPNLDLVFATMAMYSRSSFILRDHSNVIMHSYGNAADQWKAKLQGWQSSLRLLSSPFMQQWAFELGSMALFSYNLAMGPHPLHSVALEKGIDALTIEADFNGPRARQNAVECIEKLEGVVHSLSNLHERLHHSITQYLLPSPTKFVSHAEYLLPNLLIILPLVIRAATLVLLDIPQFDFAALKLVLVVGLVSVILTLTSFRTSTSTMNALYSICFLAFAEYAGRPCRRPTLYCGQSLQFLTCLTAIYMHVPLVLAHVSLAFPSAVVWSALIAFPSFPIRHALWWEKLKRPLTLLMAGFVLLVVPNKLFDGYTPFVTMVFMPLHMLVSILWRL